MDRKAKKTAPVDGRQDSHSKNSMDAIFATYSQPKVAGGLFVASK